MQPQKPKTLDPRAERLLEWMGAQPWAHLVVLGGGVALKHYLDYRGTKDCDAWWAQEATPEERQSVVATVSEELLRQNPGHAIKHNQWNDVHSLKVMRGANAVFSFQIALRSLELEPPLISAWGTLHIETLRENIASKITAMVARGAGRDFKDIYQIHHTLGVSMDELWRLWQLKNQASSVADAKKLARLHLEEICLRRPPESIHNRADRAESEATRNWLFNTFLVHDAGN